MEVSESIKRSTTGSVDSEYTHLGTRILDLGDKRKCRNGYATSLFGEQIRIDCTKGFPILTTKKIFFRGVVEELIWLFILGRTDVKWLQDRNIKIWDLWVNERGTIGQGGYAQLTHWNQKEDTNLLVKPAPGLNQIKAAVELLKSDPYSRRNFVSAWNPDQHHDTTLPPCHISHQLYCGGENMEYLDLHMYQRSADFCLGVPYNISQYGLLLFLYAKECGKIPRNLIISFGDVHVYAGHEKALEEQLSREPLPLPRLAIDAFTSMFDISDSKQIRLENYKSHATVPYEVYA